MIPCDMRHYSAVNTEFIILPFCIVPKTLLWHHLINIIIGFVAAP